MIRISRKHVEQGEPAHHEPHKIVVTSPMAKDVTITQGYVCQIHSQRHIELCALEDGYLEAIPIKEGQAVKAGELMFQVKAASSTRPSWPPSWPRGTSRKWN